MRNTAKIACRLEAAGVMEQRLVDTDVGTLQQAKHGLRRSDPVRAGRSRQFHATTAPWVTLLQPQAWHPQGRSFR